MLDNATEKVMPNPGQKSADVIPLIRHEKRGPWLQLLRVRDFEWNHVELPIADLPAELEGLRILHLSDFHTRSYWQPAYDILIERVKNNPPDLILFTGDFVDSKYDPRQQIPTAGRLVDNLKSRLGLFAILGNHDGDLVGAAMEKYNLTFLGNQRMVITSNSSTIELIGIRGVDRKDLDPVQLQSIGPKAPASVRIVMGHHPGTIRRVEFLKPDIYLCGHSHGGQVCLPGGYPILRHDKIERRLCSGIHRVGNIWHVANRGFGYSGWGLVRLFCPAEVIEITLRRA